MGGFTIIQNMRHPIPVQEVESVAMETLRGASFSTLQVLDWNEDGAVRFRVQWSKNKLIFDGIRIKECALAIVGLNSKTVIHVERWRLFGVSVL